jgi:hypothetical protein
MGVLPRSVSSSSRSLSPELPNLGASQADLYSNLASPVLLFTRVYLTLTDPPPTVLPAKTRLYFSLGLFAVGLIGLYGGDYLVPDTAEEVAIKEGDVPPGQIGGSGRV